MIDPLFPLKLSGEKERGDIAPPRGAHAVLLPAPGLERAVHLQRIEGPHRVDGAHASRRLCQAARGARVGDRGVVRRPGRDVVQDATFDVAVPLRGPRPTALGADLDHSVRGVGAVQRGCGRSLDDFDRFDVLGADVVEPRRRLTTDADGGRRLARRPVFHANAVHDDDRLVRERQAARPADADAAPRPGSTAGWQHLNTWGPGVQQVSQVRGCRLLHRLRRVDRRHGVAQLPFQLLGAGSRYHYRLERYCGGGHRKVHGRRPPGGYAHLLRSGGVPDEPHLQRILPSGNVADAIAAILPDTTPEIRAQHQHLGTDHGLLRHAIRHPPGDRALLRGCDWHGADEQHYRCCGPDDLPDKWNVHLPSLLMREVYFESRTDETRGSSGRHRDTPPYRTLRRAERAAGMGQRRPTAYIEAARVLGWDNIDERTKQGA